MYNIQVGGLINRGECSTFSPIPTNLTGGQVESMKKICKVDGCNDKHNAKGYCNIHYKMFKAYGDPLYKKPVKSCRIDGCDGEYRASGYCQKHYQKFRKYGDPLYAKTEMHGMSNTTEYKVWASMFQRCYNLKTDNYPRYGGRGITVCDRWKDSFLAFHEDMGLRPSKNHQIDREENDGNYEPDNCRWLINVENTRKQPQVKLTMLIARDIRKKYATGNYTRKRLSIEYDVTRSNVCSVINNKTWRENGNRTINNS